MKLNLDKPFYLIAEYWLGDIKGFIKLGDDRKEIEEIFKEKYMWKPNTFGVTEERYVITAKEYDLLNELIDEINNLKEK